MVFNILTLCSGTLLVGLGARLIAMDSILAWTPVVGGSVLLLLGQTVARYDDIPDYRKKLNWFKDKLGIHSLPAKRQSNSKNSNVPTAPPVR
ncbi:MAG: hypothetical protein ACE5H9_16760 [Anaerolineae bacterium]